jgi:MFS family permease
VGSPRDGGTARPAAAASRFAALIPATLLAASSLTVMSGATVAPALPAMRAHFADVEQVGLLVRLVLTLPALAIALTAPAAGWFVDRIGRKPLLIGAIIVYTIAGGSGLVLDTLTGILAGRIVLGFAVAVIMTSATALIADVYHGSARARFMGLQAGSMAFGGVVFLLLGGALADVSWRGPFLVYLLALVVLPGALRLPSRTAAATATPPTAPAPPLPVGLIAGIFAIAFLGMLAFYVTPTQVPFLIEQRVGAGGFLTGIALATSTLVAAITSFGYGRIRAQLGHMTIAATVFAFMGAGYLLLGVASSYALVLAGLAVMGIGGGMLMPNLTVWLSAAVPAAVRGRAFGGFTTAVFLGQFVSPLLSQPIVAAAGLDRMFTIVGGMLALLALALAATGSSSRRARIPLS